MHRSRQGARLRALGTLGTLGAALCASLAVMATGRAGHACSLALDGSDVTLPPDDDLTLGPSPILFSNLEPHLTRAGDDTPIAMVPAEAFDGVDLGHHVSPAMRAWRPASPLHAGAYTLATSGTQGRVVDSFFVDPAHTPTPSLERADFDVLLDTPDEDEGISCSGQTDSCDDIDFSRLTIVFSADETVAGALAEISFPGKEVTATLLVGGLDRAGATAAAPDPDAPTLLRRATSLGAQSSRLPVSFKTTRVCVALTPVDESGALGARVDLGCARPDDDDPRVTDTRGCASAEASDLTCLGLALAALALRRALM